MSFLTAVQIDGLWGDKAVKADFHPKVNFLIGANGSGKTTVLQLIASALTSDYEGLSRSPFGRIVCTISNASDPKLIRITVSRDTDQLARASFHYQVDDPTKPPFGFLLVSPHDRFLPLSVRRRQQKDATVSDQESSPINEYVRVKWLTIHRSNSRRRPEERTASEPSVDRQLSIIGNQLVRYFSKVSSKREAEVSRFLRQMLEALIYTSSDTDPLNNAGGINLVELQTAIEALIDEFLPASSTRVKNKLHQQFALAVGAAEKKSFSGAEIVALAALMPMQKINDAWRKTQKRQEDIVSSRTEFLEILNSMYYGKRLEINQRNELEVHLEGDRSIPISDLSSGEKQLLILFAEALLQEKTSFIYIADEPELSLHVAWQEKLTRNLRKINPNAQIIFATHSPDIVSEYGDHTRDMESLLA